MDGRQAIDDACVMVVPTHPYLVEGQEAIQAVIDTPRWTDIRLSDRKVSRPEEGLIVVAYKVEASKGEDERYTAYCTSTYRPLAHDEWRVVQHQQTPMTSLSGANGRGPVRPLDPRRRKPSFRAVAGAYPQRRHLWRR